MSICRRCGAIIDWQATEAGRWQPVNLDGSLHFPTCRSTIAQQRTQVQQWYRRLAELGGNAEEEQC